MYYSNKKAKDTRTSPQAGEGRLGDLLKREFKKIDLNKLKDDPVGQLRAAIDKEKRRFKDDPVGEFNRLKTLSGNGCCSQCQGGQGLGLRSRNGQVKRLLNKYGNDKVKKIYFCRSPVQKGIQKALNFLSKNKFHKLQKKMKYSEMYHLFCFMYLENGHVVRIDKNDLVDVAYDKNPESHHECIQFDVSPMSLNDLFDKMEKQNHMLYQYVPWSANCQDFQLTVAKVLGVNTNRAEEFIYQDFEKAFSPALKGFAKGVTNISGFVRRLMGKGYEESDSEDDSDQEGAGLSLPTHGGALKLAGDPMAGLRRKMAGNGMPNKSEINNFLKEHLKFELKGHPLDKKHVGKIVRNFKLHKDPKSIKEHAVHLAKQLVKNYFPGKSGSGVIDDVKDKISSSLVEVLKDFIGKRGQAGSGKKHVGIFKKIGKFLKDHHEQISKAIKTGTDIAGVLGSIATGTEAIPVIEKAVAGLLHKF